MTRKFSGIQFDSALAGLANYNTVSFFFTINAHTAPVGGATAWTSSWPLDNTNAISGIQLNYAGLETVWRPVSGDLLLNIPYTGTQYQLETIIYYSGGNLNVNTYVINETASPLSIPQFFVNVRAFLYNAPF